MKPYKELDLVQGSDEWKIWRRTHITATDTAKIMNVSPYATPLDCYHEKIDGKETPITPPMQRGIDLEPIARDFLAKKYGFELEPKCFESLGIPFMGASLDAVNKDRTKGAEIKCTGIKTHLKAIEGDIQEMYIYQCQKQMYVMGWQEIDLFYYIDEVTNYLHTIKRDKELMCEFESKELHFWHEHILKEIPPAKSFQHIKNIENIDVNELATVWRITYEAEKELKVERLVIEEKLKEISNNESAFFVDAGVKYLVIEKKGVVDWKKACVSWNITDEEIEKHRKDKSKYSKFTIVD